MEPSPPLHDICRLGRWEGAMNYRLLTPVFCIGLAIAGPAVAAPSSPTAAVNELLNADRQFSPDAISPTPAGTFARGKDEIVALLRANPNNATATAEWAPVRGGISADGQQ